nr:MAG TPA: hypothetical protein [Caudoviricetes sp.]
MRHSLPSCSSSQGQEWLPLGGCSHLREGRCMGRGP